MHPDRFGQEGDKCPICGMALESTPNDYDSYGLDIRVGSSGLVAGHRSTVLLEVRDPRTNAIVSALREVHTKRFHLFIVSDDLSFFQHLHPALRSDGRLEVSVEVPAEGLYRFLGDFFPASGTPQFVQRIVPTVNYHGRFALPSSNLQVDMSAKRECGTLVGLTTPAAIAGREQLVTFDLSDERSSTPVSDLEPYLGGFGHLLVVKEDRTVAFHSHPVEGLSFAGGPTIVFQLMFPTAGMYRMWAQFQRNGQLITASFTIEVQSNSAR